MRVIVILFHFYGLMIFTKKIHLASSINLHVLFSINKQSVNATVRHHLTKYVDLEEIKHVLERLILNLYIDHSTTSFDQLSDLDDANFDLQKWISNNFEFNKYVQSKNNYDMALAELNDYRKVLGTMTVKYR